MIPEGMRDVLPREAAELRAIETVLCSRFSAYGYGEVRTPWLEFAETMELAEDDTLEAGYRLSDEQGRQLMVRTDMTVPIARLASTRLQDKPLPQRFFYVASSVRPWVPRRSQDGQFLQAGVELLGLASAAADAECVTVLCDALSAVGLKEFRVALGSVRFYTALVDTLGLAEDDREALLEALADRDYPLLESIVGKSGAGEPARRALQRTLELSGTVDSLAQARKLATSDAMEAAVDRLVEVHDLVDDAGFGDSVTFDFGLFQDLSYYTGPIFEAYAPGVGLPIATGGRYDELLEKFEWDIPGVGFAIAVDRVQEALEEAGVAAAPAPAAIDFVGGFERPRLAAELRRAGWNVRALPAGIVTAARPLLRAEGNGFALERADGTVVAGNWRDMQRALGTG